MIDAVLSLGSNVGDCKAAIDSAVVRLAALPESTVAARSSYYRTAPVGPVDQAWFVNIAVVLHTNLGRPDLEKACRTIETALGRDRTREIPWGPRTVDIDLIAVAGDTGPPHRELANGYVIVPLAEIAPDMIVAGRTVAQVRSAADATGVEKLLWPIPPSDPAPAGQPG